MNTPQMLTQKFLLPRESPGFAHRMSRSAEADFVIAKFLAHSVKCASLNKLGSDFALLIQADVKSTPGQPLSSDRRAEENKS